MLGDKVTIISTIFLVGALFSIGMTGNASAVTVDGSIGPVEYANFVVVDKTPDLGGVYDPGTFGSFDGEPFALGGHGDWTLYWDSSSTDLFFAAEPIGSFPSHPGQSNLGIHLLQITGNPNTGVGVTGCTGTLYFPFFANGGHVAVEKCVGPGFENTLFDPVQLLPPSSTDTVFQIPVGTTITPIEWSMVRGDLDHFGDTAYTGNLQCLWFQISAFDSRSVSNGGGEGVRTIWIKFEQNTSNCGETIQVDIDIKPGSDPNSINTKSGGVVPVAILGSDTFDVTTVDVTTLMFGNASPAHDLTDSVTYDEHIQDVNGDGFDDLVSHYKQKAIGIACGDTIATLTGALNDATPIEGTDSVRPVPCK